MDFRNTWIIRLKNAEHNLHPKVVAGPGDDRGEDGVKAVVFHVALHLDEILLLAGEDLRSGNGKLGHAGKLAGHSLADHCEVATQKSTQEAAFLAGVRLKRQLPLQLFIPGRKNLSLHGNQKRLPAGEVVNETAFADTGLFGHFVQRERSDSDFPHQRVGGLEDGFVCLLGVSRHKEPTVRSVCFQITDRLVGRQECESIFFWKFIPTRSWRAAYW